MMRTIALVVAVGSLTACEAFMPPPPRAVPEPAPSGKAQLEPQEIDRGLQPVRDALSMCVDWYAGGKPEATLDIDPSGRVTTVAVGKVLNISEKKCIERDLKMARFPAFTGPAMRVVRVIEGAPAPPDGGAKG
jgi:hypothetical protein